ncbi:hypothetical protein MJO29_007484 [Puccinia striiformis f. sp. tritici]|nr:hypothetical protein MJO29_007484 [Puccinia striiformis f. sp. tritici]
MCPLVSKTNLEVYWVLVDVQLFSKACTFPTLLSHSCSTALNPLVLGPGGLEQTIPDGELIFGQTIFRLAGAD